MQVTQIKSVEMNETIHRPIRLVVIAAVCTASRSYQDSRWQSTEPVIRQSVWQPFAM